MEDATIKRERERAIIINKVASYIVISITN